jgi:hypothetical protein
LWIIAVGILVSLGINEATQIAFNGKTVKKELIDIKPTDTLEVKFINNDFFSKNPEEHEDFVFTQDSTKHEVIYSNNIHFEVKATDKAQPYLQIEKSAKGKSYNEANARAEKIKYGYKIVGNQIILDNYLLTEIASKYRDQHVELFLYLPKGTMFKLNNSVQSFDESDDEYFNLHFSSDNYVYKVSNNQVKCLNCPADENEYGDVIEGLETVRDSVAIPPVPEVPGAPVTTTTIITTTSKGGKLTKDANGVIIKTK